MSAGPSSCFRRNMARADIVTLSGSFLDRWPSSRFPLRYSLPRKPLLSGAAKSRYDTPAAVVFATLSHSPLDDHVFAEQSHWFGRRLRQVSGSTARPSLGLPPAPRQRHGPRSPSCRTRKDRPALRAARPTPGAVPLRRAPRFLRDQLATPLIDQSREPCLTINGKNLRIKYNISHLRATVCHCFC